MARYWSAMVHAIRNAVDHGLEDAESRVQAGKPPAGRIALGARRAGTALTFSIEDDGRGIDWDKVKVRAARLGQTVRHRARRSSRRCSPTASRRERHRSSAVSGRGVGLAALRQAVRRWTAAIEVESSRGQRHASSRFDVRRDRRRDPAEYLPETMSPGRSAASALTSDEAPANRPGERYSIEDESYRKRIRISAPIVAAALLRRQCWDRQSRWSLRRMRACGAGRSAGPNRRLICAPGAETDRWTSGRRRRARSTAKPGSACKPCGEHRWYRAATSCVCEAGFARGARAACEVVPAGLGAPVQHGAAVQRRDLQLCDSANGNGYCTNAGCADQRSTATGRRVRVRRTTATHLLQATPGWGKEPRAPPRTAIRACTAEATAATPSCCTPAWRLAGCAAQSQ